MSRLKWFCNHDYLPYGTNRGENLLGSVTYSVDYRCRRCLKIKRDIGYSSEASARKAFDYAKSLVEKGTS